MALTRSPGVRGETPTNGVTPKDHRLSMEAQMGGRGPGVISGCTVTGTAGWQYAVAAGELATRRAPGDGLCVWTNTSQYLAGDPSAPAPAAGTSRVDIVYARHNNMQEHGDLDSLPVIDVVRGTASSGTPVAPTLPDGAIELARKVVAAGDTSTSVGAAISHANQARAGAVGGIVVGGADQSVPSGSITQLTFPSATTTLMGDVTYSGGILTLSTPGWYQIGVYVRVTGGTATGNLELRLRAGGANVALSCTAYNAGGSWNVSTVIYVPGSTTIDAYLNQSSGATLTVANSLGSPRLTAVRIA